jgi:hypothetical protein
MDRAAGVPDAQRVNSRLALRSLATFVGLAGVTVALVWLYESMRAVMAIGGSCASGGPYVVATPCPHGSTLTTLGGILGGIAMTAVYTVFGLRQGPRLTLLVWSGVFLSLGWNFLDFGWHATDSSTRTGWLVCAGVFALLGLGPLMTLAFQGAAKDMFWSDGGGLPVGLRSGRPRRSVIPVRADDEPRHMDYRTVQRPKPEQPADDLATALAKLADLHDRGKLTDEEYADVKARILEGDR